MNSIHVVIIICFIYLLIYFVLEKISKSKIFSSLDIEKDSPLKLIQKVVSDNELSIKSIIEKNGKPSFSLEKKEIIINKGNSINHYYVAFHEVGHGIDCKKKLDEIFNYRWYHEVLYQVLSKSIIFAVLLTTSYIYIKNPLFLYGGILTGILSLIWFSMLFYEEYRATSIAIKEIKKYIKINSSENKILSYSAFCGLSSYGFLLLLSLLILIYNSILFFK